MKMPSPFQNEIEDFLRAWDLLSKRLLVSKIMWILNGGWYLSQNIEMENTSLF
jgi:hypothetical protein